MTENELSKIIVDCCYKIHKTLGPGLLESVYEEVLYYVLTKNGLRCERQMGVPVTYESIKMDIGFRADTIVESKVIVELKSVEKILPVHKKQLLTYLKLTGMKLGLLINFNEELIKASADALEGSGTEIFIIDCGWYDMMGSYIPDKNKFPNGMVPVCKYIQQKGMKPGMWFSFATANVESKVVQEHPDWILKDKKGEPALVHVINDRTLGERSYTMGLL